MKHRVSACALFAAAVILSGGTSAQALAAPPAEKAASAKGQAAESEVLRRLQELERQVSQSKEEIARLRAELAKQRVAAPIQAKPTAAKAATAGGEWDEPEVDKKAEGRDEEARRRLIALETQMRKNAAEAAKQQEEQKDKVKFDFSGKYKAQVNSRRNFNLNNSLQQWKYDNATFVDHRFSLQVDATYEALLTRLVLDKGNFVKDWKEDSEGTLERWGQFQTVDSQLVRELFVQYTGPFMVRVGRQNWDVAQKIVLDGPMDGIRLQYPLGQLPWGQTTLSAGYMAVAGGWDRYTNFNATGGRLGGNRQEIFGASNKLDAYYADLDIRASRALRLQPYVLKVVDRGGAHLSRGICFQPRRVRRRRPEPGQGLQRHHHAAGRQLQAPVDRPCRLRGCRALEIRRRGRAAHRRLHRGPQAARRRAAAQGGTRFRQGRILGESFGGIAVRPRLGPWHRRFE